ncbi:MAG: hypothetical protein NVSMB9_11150 [Isosphaeraceae bacterium]
MLILGLLHMPLPQPDFHNIRHHDTPGEICDHHDHLLRWHPGAGVASDVAVLHWHWVLPGFEPSPDEGGMAVHAHVPTWQVMAWEDDGPRVSPETASQLLARLASYPIDLPLTVPPTASLNDAPGAKRRPSLALSATFARGVSLTAFLQRWIC